MLEYALDSFNTTNKFKESLIWFMGKYPRTNAAKTESSQIKLDKIKIRNRKAQSVDKFSGVMVLYIFATIICHNF